MIKVRATDAQSLWQNLKFKNVFYKLQRCVGSSAETANSFETLDGSPVRALPVHTNPEHWTTGAGAA